MRRTLWGDAPESCIFQNTERTLRLSNRDLDLGYEYFALKRRERSEGDAVSKKSVRASTRLARASSIDEP